MGDNHRYTVSCKRCQWTMRATVTAQYARYVIIEGLCPRCRKLALQVTPQGGSTTNGQTRLQAHSG